MIKLVQVLVLAAVFAAAVSATGVEDQFQVDDDSDSDLQVLESLTDDLDDDARASALAVDPCPDRTMSCNAGYYLQTTGVGASQCTCVKCPNGMSSHYSPVKPFANVGVASCYSCPLPYRMVSCASLNPFSKDTCGDLEICIRPGNQAYWTNLFKTFDWDSKNLWLIPLMFPDLYSSSFGTLFTPPRGFKGLQTDAEATVGACATDSPGCCLPGTFGKDGSLCTTCPLTPSGNRQTSSYSTPDVNCQCPNIDTSSCKPCNICERLNSMNQCESLCTTSMLAKKCSLTAIAADPTKKITAVAAGKCY